MFRWLPVSGYAQGVLARLEAQPARPQVLLQGWLVVWLAGYPDCQLLLVVLVCCPGYAGDPDVCAQLCRHPAALSRTQDQFDCSRHPGLLLAEVSDQHRIVNFYYSLPGMTVMCRLLLCLLIEDAVLYTGSNQVQFCGQVPFHWQLSWRNPSSRVWSYAVPQQEA